MAQTAVTDALAESFVIEGGHALSGRVRAAGNKNGALPILAACLLTSEPVTLTNVWLTVLASARSILTLTARRPASNVFTRKCSQHDRH